MRKQLGLFTTLIIFCSTVFGWTANYSNRGYYSNNANASYGYESDQAYQQAPTYNPACGPVCRPRPVCQPCRPVCQPVCQTQPECPVCEPSSPAPQMGSSRICSDGVTVTATQPQLCILGDNYALDLSIQACTDVCHVEVNAILPEGVSLVRSEPEGVQTNGRTLTWSFDGMKRGETQGSRVILRADREGDLCLCFCVTAVPVQFCTILCAKPILECSKCGPCEVCPGDAVPYTITVSNKGSCAAEEVVVTDLVPDGLEHSSGLRALTFKVGTLEACQTKTINVCFTAVKRGKVCNRINVTACNANPVSCEFCTNVCKECVELIKVGPKEVPIGKIADYEITVINPGDKPLTNVVLTDQAPSATSIVEAKGAQVGGNQAVWRIQQLNPGEKQTVTLSLTTCTPGYFVNRVSVDNDQHCHACAEWGTRWVGKPALNMCFTEMEGPICIGETTSYNLRVTNQGSEEDHNLKVVVRFPKELVPVSVSGDSPGKVSGQTVTFAPIQNLGARQTVEFRIDARAKESGDARIKAEVSSDSIKTPIVQEESTIIN